MTWRDAVVNALRRYSDRHSTRLVTRHGIIAEELQGIVKATGAEGITPKQTLSRVIQELRDEGLLFFSSAGHYVLLDDSLQVEKEDLPDDVIDAAINKNRLSFGEIETGNEAARGRRRRGQSRIRTLTLQNYEGECGLCDIRDTRILVASHISRWAEDPDARGNLSNVICMCSLHDALFENGYFAIADDYTVLKKPQVESRTISVVLEMTEELRPGAASPPLPCFLQKHRLRTGFAS